MGMKAQTEGWQETMAAMKALRLSVPVRFLFPTLLVSALPRGAIGFSFERGKGGVALGSLLVVTSLAMGGLLYPLLGLAGSIIPFWLMGSTGLLMLGGGLKPLAFVKPLCADCRLFPLVQEHEAIHLSGVESDDDVWTSMRTRHTCESLSLAEDPRICWFCPIQKRLREH